MDRVVLEQKFRGWVDSVEAVAEPPQSKKGEDRPASEGEPY
jgi:hypothetical protein